MNHEHDISTITNQKQAEDFNSNMKSMEFSQNMFKRTNQRYLFKHREDDSDDLSVQNLSESRKEDEKCILDSSSYPLL